MSQIRTLLHTIELLWPKLPTLVGNDWPQFESRLKVLLGQLETEPERKSIVRALILDLFGQYTQAQQHLVKIMEELVGEQTSIMEERVERGIL